VYYSSLSLLNISLCPYIFLFENMCVFEIQFDGHFLNGCYITMGPNRKMATRDF